MDIFLETLSSIAHSSAFWQTAITCLVLGPTAVGVYWYATTGEREKSLVVQLAHDRDTAYAKQAEMEQIGQMGSFAWNFIDPALSYWSKEMFVLFGLVYRSTPPSINDILPYIHEKDRAQAAEEWQKAHTVAGKFEMSFRTVAPSGQTRHVHIAGRSIIAPDHRLSVIQGIARDVTKEMEVDKAKTEFVSLASHQLKTPLTSVSWLAEMLMSEKAGPLNPKQKEYVGNIEDASKRMGEMVNELLSVSRLELGTLALHITEFDLKGLVENTIAEQRHAADFKHVVIDLSYEGEMPRITADENLLRMIIQNLVSNAIKYSPHEGKVQIVFSMSGAAKQAVYMKVADNGIGIPLAEQGQIFEKLHRAENAQVLVPDGTGLGLYVVKTILDRVGGAVSFVSKEGVGTTFTVSFPIAWKDAETIGSGTV